MHELSSPLIVPFLVFLVMLLSWPLSSLIIQNFTRWGKVSEQYPLRSEFTGKWIDWQILVLRAYSSIKGCISIGFSDEFLYVKFLFPFIKPIQIPWSHIESIKEKKLLWIHYCEFVIQGTPSLTVYRSQMLSNYFKNYTGKARPVLDFIRRQDIFPDVLS